MFRYLKRIYQSGFTPAKVHNILKSLLNVTVLF